VRVAGPAGRVSDDEAVRYWETRPRGHRLSAWASPQSEVVDQSELDRRVTDIEARFVDVDPPLPSFWGGFVVGVDELELWHGRADRLHDRARYRRAAGRWIIERLAP
jgi:pyridoxamine 5'-phosphate oxidase